MIISIISAVADNMIIGNNNSLPWDMPADLKYFKKTTLGNPVIMGARTFESIGKALPNRKNIILSDDKNYKTDGCVVVDSIENALKEAKKNESSQNFSTENIEAGGEVFIAGGASIYKQFLPMADKLYLTFIHHNFKGDVSFPKFDKNNWNEIKRIDNEPDEENKYPYSFVIFERKN